VIGAVALVGTDGPVPVEGGAPTLVDGATSAIDVVGHTVVAGPDGTVVFGGSADSGGDGGAAATTPAAASGVPASAIVARRRPMGRR
jgi:hypothetical protein